MKPQIESIYKVYNFHYKIFRRISLVNKIKLIYFAAILSQLYLSIIY